MKFFIPDGYPKASRDQFDEVGMTLAGQLYADLVTKHIPEARCTIVYSSDVGIEMPTRDEVSKYDGILWPGCCLTSYHSDDERVTKLIKLCNDAFETGVPQFGSCFALHLAVQVAGGKVAPNPKGREMGIARKIHLTDAGRDHPMYENKPIIFDGFISHDDEIVEFPKGGEWLSSNSFTRVQSGSLKFKNGEFWATQYHPEYNLHEMARLIVAREGKLTKQGYFTSHENCVEYVELLETIAKDPSRKDLRWMAGIDDDLLDDSIREREFTNWVKYCVSSPK